MRLGQKIARAAVLAAAVSFPASAATVTNLFGFSGKEIFPVDPQINNLHAADLDGDGLNDLIVVNNLRSKINLLYNLTGKTNRTGTVSAKKLELNELPPDSRFRIDSIPTEQRIAALCVADVNGDGKPDLVYFGDAKDLTVRYNLGTNGWSAPKSWHLEDGQLTPNALATGDLNGDGRTDIVLLGDSGALYFLAQQADHTLADPVKISYSGTPKAVALADIDGDGKDDLLFVDFDNSSPFRVRFQIAGGQLGPEVYFKTQPVRSFWIDTLAGDKVTYLTAIVTATGRGEVSGFKRKTAEPLAGAFRAGQMQILPLNHSDAGARGVLWADVNGDGRADLIVAEPESGQLSIYLQQADGTLAAPKKFPSLAGVSQIAVADWNNAGHPEIFLLSRDENSVAMTQFDKNGRLPFPTPLPLDGKPLAMTVGALKPGGKPTLAIIVDKDGARSLVTRTADGKIMTQKLSDNFHSNPTTFAVADVNQDGLADLVLLMPYEKIKVLLQQKDGKFAETDVDPPGGAMEQPWLALTDLNGNGKPDLLLPQKNFVRAVVLEAEPKIAGSTNAPVYKFRVQDQINGSASDSRIVGAAALVNGTNTVPSLFLFDAEHKQLTLCERDAAGVWQVVKNVDLPVTSFTALRPVAFGKSAVAFTGQNAVAWLPLAGDVWQLNRLDDYDTPIKDGYLNDVTAGDLLGHGRKQLIFMETAKNYLDLVLFDQNRKLVPGDRWQVFEQHTFRGAQNALPEPRECVVADVTGDGKNDLIVLVHDRLLVYPQE
jgi:FG-GAP-like repeat